MKMRNQFRAGLAALLGLSSLAVAARADEETIAPNKLPAAVRTAVKKKFPEASIRGAAREVEDGKAVYEVELTVEGRAVDVALSADGKILEVEKEVRVDRLPEAVRKGLATRFPGARIEKAEAITKGEDGPVHYEFLIKAEVVLTAKGKVVRAEEEDEEDEKPSAKAKDKKEKEDEDDDEDEDEDEDDDHKASTRAKHKGEKHDRDDDEDDDHKASTRAKHKGEKHGEHKSLKAEHERGDHESSAKAEHEHGRHDDHHEHGEHKSSAKAEHKHEKHDKDGHKSSTRARHREDDGHRSSAKAKKREEKDHEDDEDEDNDDREVKGKERDDD